MIRVSDEILKGPSNVSDLHRKFVEVIKEVLPEKHEILYARLVSLIEEYQAITSKIERSNENFDLASTNIEHISEELEKLKKEILELEIEDLDLAQKLNNIAIDSPNRTSLMRERLTTVKNTLKKQERAAELAKTKENNVEYMEDINSNSMSYLLQSLEEKISEIKEVQAQIESIKLDGIDRLDHLEIMNKHLSAVQKIIDSDKRFKIMSEEERKQVFDTLVSFMEKYFSFRAATFKLAEKTSSSIVESYASRDLLPSNDSGINLINSSDILAGSWEVPEVIDGLLPFKGISIDSDAIRKIDTITKGYEVMTSLNKKKIDGTYSLEDTKQSIEALDKLKLIAMANRSGPNYSEVFGEPSSYLGNYEYYSKKEKMAL